MCFLAPSLYPVEARLFLRLAWPALVIERRFSAPIRHGITTGMARLDKYNVIGLILLAVIAVLWIAHFVLPTPPPLDDPECAGPACATPLPALPPRLP